MSGIRSSANPPLATGRKTQQCTRLQVGWPRLPGQQEVPRSSRGSVRNQEFRARGASEAAHPALEGSPDSNGHRPAHDHTAATWQEDSLDDDASGIWHHGASFTTAEMSCWDCDAPSSSAAVQIVANAPKASAIPRAQAPTPWSIMRPVAGSPDPSVTPAHISSTPVLRGLPQQQLTAIRYQSREVEAGYNYDATSDDEELIPALYDDSAMPGGGKGVAPHSGLEAQDAADYEQRLNAAEAREAFIAGMSGSGQSSDDEDSRPGVDYTPAIEQHTAKATQARAARRARRREATLKFGVGGERPLGGEWEGEAVGEMWERGVAAAGSGDEGAGEDPVLLAAQLLASNQLDQPTPTASDMAVDSPNRFVDLPEPLEPDNLLLAVQLLQQQQPQASATSSTSSSLDELIDTVNVQLSPEMYTTDKGLSYTLGRDKPVSALGGAKTGMISEPGVGAKPSPEDRKLRALFGAAEQSMDEETSARVVQFLKAEKQES